MIFVPARTRDRAMAARDAALNGRVNDVLESELYALRDRIQAVGLA